MVTEIELKYSILEDNELATSEQIQTQINLLLSKHTLVFSHKEKQLSNYYFDTTDLALRKSKIALRTRGTKSSGEDERFEQTIKTSGTVIAGLHQRPEYNVDIDNDKPILDLFPQVIWQPNTDINQLQENIVELFSTHFTRQTWLVTIDNSEVEIAFDCGEISCDGQVEKPRIYEIELELVSGNTQVLFVLTKILFSQLNLRPGHLTKAARGYALYHEGLTEKHVITKLTKNKNIINKTSKEHTLVDYPKSSVSIIKLLKNHSINEAFTNGIASILTQLQLSVDGYVEAISTDRLSKLNKVSELLALLRQGFWIFKEQLTDEQIALRSELSYFIRTIHWVEHAYYIQLLINKKSSYQKEASVSQALITKLQLTQNSYPSESQVLAILHSERFNLLQLDLLSLLLKVTEGNNAIELESFSLVNFSAKQLTNSTKALNDELAQLTQPENISSTELYLTAHSLLIRALLTSSWFSYLFIDLEADIVTKFNMPWLDMKLGVSELQSLTVLRQQLEQLPLTEQKLTQWLNNKSENLVIALDQSRAKSLTMISYW